MKVLITGAAGFIGFHTARKFLEGDLEVIGVDNLNRFYDVNLKKLRLAELNKYSRFRFLNFDIRNDSLNDLISEGNFDSVVHLAAQASVRLPLDRTKEYLENNVLGYVNILQACITNNVKNLVYASSSSVYGNSSEEMLDEKNSNSKPISAYGLTKKFDEDITKLLNINSDLKTIGLRFFTVYGAWGRPDMAYFRLIKSAILNEPFRLFGSSKVVRDFTYIDDVVNSIDKLLVNFDKIKSEKNEIVNVGLSNPSSLQNMIEIIERISGNSINIVNLEKNKFDVNYTKADSRRLLELTGIQPKTNLENGLEAVFKWMNDKKYRSQLRSWTESTI